MTFCRFRYFGVLKNSTYENGVGMKRTLFATVLMVLVCGILCSVSSYAATIQLPATGQTKCYDTAGAEIACAGTGQDGEIQAGRAWPNPRFTDNGNGTVTDSLTGLIWLKNANCFGQKTWASALIAANMLGNGACGLNDGSIAGQWRLPNIHELESLVDAQRWNPALPSDHLFSNIIPNRYWSSSSYVYNTLNAWNIGMQGGYVNRNDKSNLYYVLPVYSAKQ